MSAAQGQGPDDGGLHVHVVHDSGVDPPAVPPDDTTIEVDSQNDADSGYGDSGAESTYSASIASSVLNYTYQNGRRYHAFREGAYMLPNDDREQDRMDLHHHVFVLSLGGKLICAPLTKAPDEYLMLARVRESGQRNLLMNILALKSFGIDLSPIQSSWVPPNCKFYVDDAESVWPYKPDEAFDYIHARGLGGSIANWGQLYGQIYQHLNPGGWCEFQEYEGWIHSDDDTMNRGGRATQQWLDLLDEATIKFGKQLNVAGRQKQWMIDAGFVDVQEDIYKVPIGTWPKDKKLKELGLYQREQMVECVEAFTLAPLTRILGWSIDEAEILMANVRAEFRNPQNHLYTVFHFVYGRKPTGDT